MICPLFIRTVVTVTRSVVPAFPPKGEVTLGLVGGVVSVAFLGADVETLLAGS